MSTIENKNMIDVWRVKVFSALSFLLRRWYLLVLATAIGGAYGYYKISKIKPTYTATYSFVLSTDQRSGGGVAGLASQLGFDAMTSSPDNIFSGDNIMELFKSRKLIGSALLSVIDTSTHQTLINFITQRQYNAQYKRLGIFGNDPSKYTAAQTRLYRMMIGRVGGSYLVFKKDKKLIVYLISATSTDPDVAFYVAKTILNETAQYFIDTKTKVAASSVYLLKHEADSLETELSKSYSSTARMIDRTYNLNPSVTVQRSASMFSQAKSAAYTAAYSEVMRNLEIAKINLQKETPLYRIIDEPELPLLASAPSKRRYVVIMAGIGFVLMTVVLIAIAFYKDILLLFK